MKKIFTLLFACITLLANAQSGLLNGTGYAPDITVTDINGNSHNLYSYLGSGKMVVLELMSTTCGHCQMYTSGTENSYQSYGPNGADVAEFIGLEVNSSTTDNDVANFATTYNVGFPICNNISPSAINYQLYYTPSYYVIYPDSSYTTICPMYCNDNSSYSTIEGLLNAAIQAGLPPVYGCTDASAINFDSTATVDDGTCNYTSYDIKTLGMSFSPDTIVCDVGDTINFILGNGHNAVEVADSTWIAGGNAPIAGGFSFAYGATGMFIPDDCHTFYYVCQPHASSGMKGVIIAHHPPVFGCTDSLALNYDTLATVDDTSCTYCVWGCTDPFNIMYNPIATCDDGSCYSGIQGCTDPTAINYNSQASTDDGSCTYPTICNKPIPTGIYVDEIIQVQAKIHWDNMSSTATVPTTHYINAGNYYYSPSALTINAGDTVIWINDGGYHNVNFDISAISGQSYNNPESFITNPTTSSNMASYVFSVAGNYTYDCSVGSHAANGMVGTIQVNPSSNSTCMALKYYVNVREVGTSSWSWRVAQDAGLCNQGLPTTSKVMINLSPSTDYEYRVKAFYCNTTGSSAWSPMGYFRTADACPNVTNLTATPGPQAAKCVFSWDTLGAYSMVRIKLRVDSISNPVGSDWQMAGGFGVNYPALTVNKWGLNPGETYRGQARTWCNPSGGLYRSVNWTSLIWWTQPSAIRMDNTNNKERELVKITDLLGREVHPEKVIDKTTLFYIYSDGTVEKKIIIE